MQFRSSCHGVCEAGSCRRLVPTVATNVHYMCQQFLQWHDDVLPEDKAWQTRDNVLQAGVPFELNQSVRELCRQCTSTTFLRSSGTLAHRSPLGATVTASATTMVQLQTWSGGWLHSRLSLATTSCSNKRARGPTTR